MTELEKAFSQYQYYRKRDADFETFAAGAKWLLAQAVEEFNVCNQEVYEVKFLKELCEAKPEK